MEVFNNLRAILTRHKENMPVVAVAEMLAEIDEAEAKWEADCCEWTELIEYKQRVYANCRFTNDSLDAMSIGYFKFCPYCGKRIKISEVE